jgi:hypothetical protein
MQQVINANERRNAFWQYLIFFLLTVGLIVTAIFFNFHLPKEVNRVLRTEVTIQRQETLQQEEFVSVMREAKLLLDSLEKPGTNEGLIIGKLEEKIKELSNIQLNEGSLNGQTNKALVNMFWDLSQARKALKTLGEKTIKISQLETDLSQCKGDLNTALIQLRNSPN